MIPISLESGQPEDWRAMLREALHTPKALRAAGVTRLNQAVLLQAAKSSSVNPSKYSRPSRPRVEMAWLARARTRGFAR